MTKRIANVLFVFLLIIQVICKGPLDEWLLPYGLLLLAFNYICFGKPVLWHKL